MVAIAGNGEVDFQAFSFNANGTTIFSLHHCRRNFINSGSYFRHSDCIQPMLHSRFCPFQWPFHHRGMTGTASMPRFRLLHFAIPCLCQQFSAPLAHCESRPAGHHGTFFLWRRQAFPLFSASARHFSEIVAANGWSQHRCLYKTKIFVFHTLLVWRVDFEGCWCNWLALFLCNPFCAGFSVFVLKSSIVVISL